MIGRSFLFSFLFLFCAQTHANVVGSDAQNFNATPDGFDFVTVQSSQVLEPGYLNVGWFVHYSVNTLPYINFGSVSNPQKEKINDDMWAGDINFALGLSTNLEVGFSMPYLLDQHVDDRVNVGRYEERGFTEYRPSLKYRLIRNTLATPWGMAVVASTNFNRIKNNPYVGVNGGPTYNLELAFDRAFGKGGKYKTAFNIGHRWRDSGSQVPGIDIEPYPNQYIASAALSYYVEQWDSKLIGEIFGSYPSEQTNNYTDREISSLEMIAGIKYDMTTQLALHTGIGSELMNGTATPDLRVYAGLNYAFGPVWETDGFETESAGEFENLRMQNLRFEFNSTELTKESRRTLEKAIKYLNNYKTITRLIVEGHTDSVGKAAYNKHLSQERANAVRDFLKKQLRFKNTQYEAIGYGMERPLFDNSNFQGRAKNRRVELRIRGVK